MEWRKRLKIQSDISNCWLLRNVNLCLPSNKTVSLCLFSNPRKTITDSPLAVQIFQLMISPFAENISDNLSNYEQNPYLLDENSLLPTQGRSSSSDHPDQSSKTRARRSCVQKFWIFHWMLVKIVQVQASEAIEGHLYYSVLVQKYFIVLKHCHCWAAFTHWH